MRRLILAAVVFAGCTKSDPQRTPHDGVATRDAGDPKMPAGSVSLKLVADVSGQPSEAVAWSADGIVTAGLNRVVRWVGDQPGTPIEYATRAYGKPKSISLLPDGVVGVGALRIARDGSTIVDNAKLGAALVEGVNRAQPRQYGVGAAAWTPDGAHLWLGVERRKGGSRDAPPTHGKPVKQFGPAFRNLIVDAQLASQVDLSSSEPRAWTSILAAGPAVVTIAYELVVWPAGPTGTRNLLEPAPPAAVAMDPAGTIVGAATYGGVKLWRAADGATLVTWNATGTLNAMAIAADGAWVALGSATTTGGGLLQLWHVDAGKAELAAELALPEAPLAMAFSPDGASVVVGGMAQRVVVVSITR